ncbi:hypothetical protein L1987_64150 [Smallanthus sonchifolius]|uniref:Uncharacterized protein n=1 Tax=Smallanthus sonchifolius TaxID=185202 RepID=A0ACB9CF67_9ASTR|nr:hypothetical protein L1987_64150 [Smallanthus sonchifolius]
MNLTSYYYKLNYNEDWISTRRALAKENGVPIEDIPTKVFLDDEVWSEDDPQTDEWSESINEYYNERLTKCSLYNEIFEVNTKEMRMFGDTPKDNPLHQDPPEFTIEMLNIPAKFKRK